MTARQPLQRFRMQLDGAGVRVELDRAPRSSFDVSFAELGCPTQMAALERGGEPILGEGHNRVEVARSSSLTEWYVNGPLGVEQGLTLTSLPDCAETSGVLVVSTRKNSGWRVEARPSELVAFGPAGAAFHYGSVAAFDAKDRELPARATTDGESFTLEITVRDAALPITIDPLIWVASAWQALRPVAGDVGDSFGNRVVLSEDSALISAFGRNAFAGEAYAYFREGDTWSAEQRLAPEGLAADDFFGFALASDGTAAVVTAPFRAGSGAAYLYERVGSAWQEPPTPLTPTTPLAAGDFFGGSVAQSGSTILVGAPYAGKDAAPDAGLVYVFDRVDGEWQHVGELAQPEPQRADFNGFGEAVALHGDVALVGAPYTPTGGEPGAAYVFQRSAGVWGVGEPLTPGSNASSFGSSVALAHGRAAVGAPFHADSAGRFFIFEKDAAGAWAKKQDFEGVEQGGALGTSLALSGDILAVGKPHGVGTVYPYVRDARNWQSRPELSLTDAQGDDQFGASVSLVGPRLLVGAVNGRSGALGGPGSAHLILLDSGSDCEHDDDCASGHCSRHLCCNTACTDACYSCNGADTGKASGTCALVEAETDPNGSCAGSTCTSPVIATTSLCDPAGACRDYPVSCGSFRCEGSACLEVCADDSDCAETAFCRGASCESKRPIGASCEQSNQCDSEFCVDGSCCNESCDGQCEACDEPGSVGKCLPVEGAPRGERKACEQAKRGAPCSQVSCDGMHTDSCLRFKGGETVCEAEACEAGLYTPAGRCDGKGGCEPSLPISCGDYACGADKCLDGCTSDGDCASDRYCNEGTCGTTRSCVDDQHDADNTNCGDFVCRHGSCLAECKATEDCLEGLSCNTDTGACALFRAQAQSAGCNVALSPNRHPHPYLTALVFALALARIRRRSVSKLRSTN